VSVAKSSLWSPFLTRSLDAFYPPSPNPGSLLHCGMASHFMTEQSYARQVGFVEKAEEQGKLVYKGEMDASTRRMGFSLVKLAEDGVGETGGLVEEEIFGAVVPIIPVSVSRSSAVDPAPTLGSPLTAELGQGD